MVGQRGGRGRRGSGNAPITLTGGRTSGRGGGIVKQQGRGGGGGRGRGSYGGRGRGGPAARGRGGGRGGYGRGRGGRGGRGRGGRGRGGPPPSKLDLDADLDSYFLQDKDVGAKHLDSELDNYFKQRDATKKQADKPPAAQAPAAGDGGGEAGGPAPMQS
ncbi:hypothetical protein DUNSADRAFT_18425 [Dunaliella salina]|uniref:Chromatin target of PRMT1 protein C-terminal domain-containing protein n=1 Tax=Dunaliella salina TaxID=3046 RepID=A0ABQ7GZ61_DUNSA|nr:hypothetical protein DUNSADRAFT_18425 [Dunaliella salina]|eukprot:KAF5839882.1 hypothetical protein DUNSADRAFT_18425 [Dunaliella salina]